MLSFSNLEEKKVKEAHSSFPCRARSARYAYRNWSFDVQLKTFTICRRQGYDSWPEIQQGEAFL